MALALTMLQLGIAGCCYHIKISNCSNALLHDMNFFVLIYVAGHFHTSSAMRRQY